MQLHKYAFQLQQCAMCFVHLHFTTQYLCLSLNAAQQPWYHDCHFSVAVPLDPKYNLFGFRCNFFGSLIICLHFQPFWFHPFICRSLNWRFSFRSMVYILFQLFFCSYASLGCPFSRDFFFFIWCKLKIRSIVQSSVHANKSEQKSGSIRLLNKCTDNICVRM